MPINFPDSPTTGDTHTVGDKTWTYDGTAWNVVQNNVADHGNLGGLADDDHTQYLLADGTRTATELTVTNDLTVDTDTLHVDSTNNRVGIGTNSPSELLDINAGTAGSVELSTTGGRTIQLTANDSEPYLSVGSTTSHSAAIMTNGVRRLTVDSSGNVGIGAISPSYTLDVDGDINMRTGHSFYYDAAGATNPNPIFWIDGENTDIDIIRVGTDQFVTDSDYGMTLKYRGSGSGNDNTFDIEMDAQAGAQVVAMRIYQDGTVTKPQQPAFAVYQTGSADVTYNGIANMTNALTNVGGHYNLSTDRFTAPVAGLYCFLWSAYTNTTTSHQRSAFWVNGSVALQVGGSGYSHNTICAVFPLAANDYVQFGGVGSSLYTHYYGSYGHNQFSGWLIG